MMACGFDAERRGELTRASFMREVSSTAGLGVNRRKEFGMKSVDELIAEVAKRAECLPDEVEWYSWPQSFGTTAGPGGGAGGNMITSFQVYAFDAPGEKTRYCAGQWRRWNGEFQQRW